MDYLQSGAALRVRWWQFGLGWGITGDRHGAGSRRETMSQQAQIDALEHLVMTLIKKNRSSLSVSDLFEDAGASVMSERNASGNEFKSEAKSYLEHLKTIWKV
jgi:hypothetical protein